MLFINYIFETYCSLLLDFQIMKVLGRGYQNIKLLIHVYMIHIKIIDLLLAYNKLP